MPPNARSRRVLLATALALTTPAAAGEPPPKSAPSKPQTFKDPLALLRAVASGATSLPAHVDARRGVLEVHFEVYAAVKGGTWSQVLCEGDLEGGLAKVARQIAIFVEQSPTCDAVSCSGGGDEAGPRTTFRFRKAGARGLVLDEVDYLSVVNPPGFDDAAKKFLKEASATRKPCARR